jgi:hypothetical protein
METNGGSVSSLLERVPTNKAFQAMFFVIWTLVSIVVTFLLWDRNEFQSNQQKIEQRVFELEKWRVATEETRYRPSDALADQRRLEDRTSTMVNSMRTEMKQALEEIKSDLKDIRDRIQ